MAGRISSGECPLQAGGVNLPQWASARALVHPYMYCKRPHSSAGKVFSNSRSRGNTGKTGTAALSGLRGWY